MTALKGQNLRVFVKTGSGTPKCIAMATSCTFHIGSSLEDISTKDDGDWSEQDIVGLNWNVSTESLVTLTDNGANGELSQDLLSLIINKTKVTLTFDQTAGANNRVGQESAIKRSGEAYLVDYSIDAQNRANSRIRCQFTGTGALS